MLRQHALGRIGHEAGDHLFRLEAGHRGGLGEALLGQRGLVVDEVPVGPADEADVRLQDQHAAARLEQRERHAQLLEHSLR